MKALTQSLLTLARVESRGAAENEVVDVANMRHLWLFPAGERPAWAWRAIAAKCRCATRR